VRFSRQDVEQSAIDLGFPPDSLEKVFRLLSLLDALRANAFLRPRLALKGGTALNLFLFDLPRLSVDIDLNYVGSSDRDVMLADKPKLEQAIQAVCSREGLTVKRVPTEHAGGKWRLSYMTVAGSTAALEIDVNFMLRGPLWPVTISDSGRVGTMQASGISVLDPHELAAGKLAALCSRNASRDLFDARALLRHPSIERNKLRLAFVVYGGINRKDWRTVELDDIDADPQELKRELGIMLRREHRPANTDLIQWTRTLVDETRALMASVLPLEANELEFIERLNAHGEIVPSLLTSDGAMQEKIEQQPGLQWKAKNVKQRMGTTDLDDLP